MKDRINSLDELSEILDGEIGYDTKTKAMYATDASVYREEPVAVAWPGNENDIISIIGFARSNNLSITVRAAGTSLAGQVVSGGIIVDVSRHMNRIIEIDPENMWAKVEPGVVLDELNMKLRDYGLFFGPETSTSNRCNLGGMVGNNACGSHSLVYGSTRDHTIELRTILSDGSVAVFGPLGKDEYSNKCRMQNLEGKIYRTVREILDNPLNKESIKNEYPDPKVERRNTGYALDLLLDSEIFSVKTDKKFNFCKLISGSEGTLGIATEIKLNLVPLPPANKALVCVHLRKRNDAFRANLVALRHGPVAVEMMDDRILALTEENISQRKNRFFLEGKPGSILIVELARNTMEEIDRAAGELIADMKASGFGYAFPVIKGSDITKVWNLRKAGLGVLSNMRGDGKPVTLMEDTSVSVEVLPDYMEDIEKMLSKHGKEAVYHAHIGTGELHIRPVLNLKDKGDADLFRVMGQETAEIVKKYRGSLSGEHGDGRLRGEFIPFMLGKHNYELLKQVKECWDPDYILNPGKIINTPPMNTFLRHEPGVPTADIETIYDFSSSDGIIRAAERCNGSGDCRKSVKIGGIMCPTFMATGDEDKTTRARANVLREFLKKEEHWDHPEIYEILDLCIGCKGCKSECPSNVDMAKLKSEFLQHWYDKHGISLRTRIIAYITVFNHIGSFVTPVYNFFLKNSFTSGLVKKAIGFAPKRSIPLLYRTTLRKWISKNLDTLNPKDPVGTVCLFVDEFTNYNDTEAGIAAVRLLTGLQYKVVTADHHESARTFISKGMVRTARKKIRKNISALSGIIGEDLPLIGIEPSAILGFRDEYPELAGRELQLAAGKIAANAFMLDEFILKEFRAGRIKSESFTMEKLSILVHAHCQQKAIASSASTVGMLSIPGNYSVKEIPSGCCGMAGSFGYEKEHFDLSNKIGEMILFPEVRKASAETIIAAPGTSCRHHIKDGTGRTAVHPAVVMWEALKSVERKA
ncbi:MAG TPA: FAD-linked oxidase C-terminal domain-containing protein [Bacteroidales bacterium]|nr:FAD-linked oxidase C-terminal domain-containing protein [Bacteroidales bacterium]